MNTIGILGGTFDPVHLGHLYIANAALNHLPIQKIKFIPSFLPVHRSKPVAPVEDRVAMLRLAIQDQPKFEIDLREVEREEPSYMIDTLLSLRKDYPQSALGLILGMDAYQNITSWKRWQELLDYAHFIVISRSQIDQKNLQEPLLEARINDDLNAFNNSTHGQIFLLKVAPCSISATKVRHYIQCGNSIAQLVPSKVAQYIHDHHLYRYK